MDAMKIRGTGNVTTASLEQASPALRTTEGKNAAQVQANNLSEVRPGQGQNKNVQNNAADAATKRIDSDTIRANAEAAEETKEALMDRSVVARDRDGDTLAVSKAAEEDLDERRQGSVTEKDAEKTAGNDTGAAVSDEAARRSEQSREARIELIAEQRAAREAARERAAEEAAEERQAQAAAEETQAPEITSFAGVTNNQLEQYYLQGRISRNDYEKEIDSREELVKAKEENNAQNAADLARLDATKRNVQEGAEAIANANFAAGNDGMRGLERFEAARNANDRNDDNNAFENAGVNVAGVNAAADTVSLRTDDGAVRAARHLTDRILIHFLGERNGYSGIIVRQDRLGRCICNGRAAYIIN